MSTLFSVAKLLGKGRRERSVRRAASNASLGLGAEKDKDTSAPRSLASSKLSTVVITGSALRQQSPSPENTDIHIAGRHSPAPRSMRADSIDAVLSSDNESMLSFYGTPLMEEASVAPKVMRGGDGKEEVTDEPGYAMVPPPKVIASEEWTQLDISHKVDDIAAAVSGAVQQERERGAAELEVTTRKYDEELKAVREECRQAAVELEAATRKHERELQSIAHERQSAAADLQAATRRHEELHRALEAQDRAQEHARQAEAELRIAQDDLIIKTKAFTGLEDEVSHLSQQIDYLEAQKMQLQVELESAQFSGAAEADRLQGVISLERTQNQDKIAELSSQVEQLEDRLAEQGERITYLEKEISEGQEEAREVYAQNYELETQLLHYEERAAQAKSDDETRDIQIAMLDDNNAQVTAQLVDVQNSLASMERQNRMLIDQLRQQSSEIGASKGLRRPPAALTDRPSRLTGVAGNNRLDSAVRVIKMLNDEIYQTAASMTDQLESISTGISARFVAGDERRTALAASLKSVLGTELITSLSRGPSALAADDSNFFIQVQTGLQGCLIASCMRFITSWYPTEWEYGTFLVALFERIRGSDGVEKALQWRKTALKNCVPPANLNEKILMLLMEEITKVFALCGWKKERKLSELIECFAPKLSEIATLAVRLNKWTAAGVFGETECIVAEPGLIFDSNHMANDDDFRRTDRRRSTRNVPPNEQVICTIGLGIQTVRNADEEEDRLLLKPKVVLYGAIF